MEKSTTVLSRSYNTRTRTNFFFLFRILNIYDVDLLLRRGSLACTERRRLEARRVKKSREHSLFSWHISSHDPKNQNGPVQIRTFQNLRLGSYQHSHLPFERIYHARDSHNDVNTFPESPHFATRNKLTMTCLITFPFNNTPLFQQVTEGCQAWELRSGTILLSRSNLSWCMTKNNNQLLRPFFFCTLSRVESVNLARSQFSPLPAAVVFFLIVVQGSTGSLAQVLIPTFLASCPRVWLAKLSSMIDTSCPLGRITKSS
jgi:hypothetical protein